MRVQLSCIRSSPSDFGAHTAETITCVLLVAPPRHTRTCWTQKALEVCNGSPCPGPRRQHPTHPRSLRMCLAPCASPGRSNALQHDHVSESTMMAPRPCGGRLPTFVGVSMRVAHPWWRGNGKKDPAKQMASNASASAHARRARASLSGAKTASIGSWQTGPASCSTTWSYRSTRI
jgi:hypothetical protein